ncbi:hypothetical protein A2867_04940 [Candidatus Daviesbacteria bacterium RIFCSPHIGHO2_01_FULL_40_11]|uniref:HicB-like antitoxin of toxin-antitoxin system domain-containing protein n=1 Tax=Candidatus Daviesbacteria bacterium RIFCSPHIGHO2_01_FULL_40_11 TaxID=1797762 RepID=A0A1F5JIF0_9BACT|nr:MAG: hypothetical protein A2867_04940 [Candidatus Daviesbacteria bacterium RIFCSPHIGHO2_01_FULL_40_11]
MQLDFRIEIFKEGKHYVAVAPELNVSSFGSTQKEAKNALREAVELFLEECKRMGTLDDVLIEAGFKPKKRQWRSNDPLITERMALGI